MKERAMAHRSEHPNLIPTDAFELGFRFLQARRAQNLSFMRFAEQSLRSLAEVQRAAGAGGAPLARLSTAHAGFVRDSAKVYGTATAHLAR
jgi:hypothetical protein